jgi:TPR repeat protein
MITCNIKEMFDLTDESLKDIGKENIVCYVHVGGNPGGGEGDVYVFVLQGSNLAIYRGNIYHSRLSKEKIDKLLPSKNQNGWVEIPFGIGHYVYVKQYMAKALQENWKKENTRGHHTRLVMGIYHTVQQFEGRLIAEQRGSEIEDGMMLSQIVRDYPDAWNNPKRLKALLSDYYPENKLLRNLLLTCVAEGITNEIFEQGKCSNADVYRYAKIVVKSHGCTIESAQEVVNLWIAALKADEYSLQATEENSFEILLEDVTQEIGGRPYNCLKRAGINKLGDLTEWTFEELRAIRNLGPYSCDKIVKMLTNHNVSLKKESALLNSLEEMDIGDMELSVRSYNSLKRAKINKLKDILNMDKERFLQIGNLNYACRREIVDKLEELGVPYERRMHLNNVVDEERTEVSEGIQSLGQDLNKIQSDLMNTYIALAFKKIAEGDYLAAVEAGEKSVELGFRGNYSHIAMFYLAGYKNVPKDYEKAYKWLKRYHDDVVVEDRITADDKGDMVQICFKLGGLEFIKLLEKNGVSSLLKSEINNALNLYREAIDFGIMGKVKDKNIEEDGTNLMLLAFAFYKGEITIQDVHSEKIFFDKDMEYAFKGFEAAEQLGNYRAKLGIAEMYGLGIYVAQDIDLASEKYLEATLHGEPDAKEWCQNYFIDELPWDKRSDWSNVALKDLLQQEEIEYANEQNLYSLEDIRNIKIENFILKNEIPFPVLRNILFAVRRYMNNSKL